MTDMQICEGSQELHAGDPMCSPVTMVMVEATVSVIRTLFSSNVWAPHINKKILQQIDKIKELERSVKLDGNDTCTLSLRLQ